jgi:hypothetical protein
VRLEEGVEVVLLGGCVEKLMLASFRVKKAAHGIEFTEIESENFYCSVSPLGLGLEI